MGTCGLIGINSDDQGNFVQGEGDILAAYVAKTLIENAETDPDLGDGGRIAVLTALLDQAITDLARVCAALETREATTQEAR
jgi:hypothetical protein